MSATKFTLQTLEILQRYFPLEKSDAQTFSFYHLKGYLTALVCSPVPLSFAEWWAALKTAPGLDIQSKEAENELLPLMMTLMDKTRDALVAGQTALPEPIELADYDYGSTPVEQWCQGFMEGLRLSEDVWFSPEYEEERENMELSFGVVAMLASREDMRRKVDAEKFDERMNSGQKMLPEIVRRLFQIGKSKK
ncbi:MAG: YecA family protein [Chromatiales bacterium]|nr:YecA family protein [Chromatiales bacterium]